MKYLEIGKLNYGLDRNRDYIFFCAACGGELHPGRPGLFYPLYYAVIGHKKALHRFQTSSAVRRWRKSYGGRCSLAKTNYFIEDQLHYKIP